VLLLPEGKWFFVQEVVSVNEELVVEGEIVILNARPQSKDGVHGVKLEMLSKEETKVEVIKIERSA